MGFYRYCVFIDDICIARDMSMEHAVIFLKALFNEYYNDHEMAVAIKEEPRSEPDDANCNKIS